MHSYIVRKRITRWNRWTLDVAPGLPAPAPVPEGWTRVDADSEIGARVAFVTGARSGRVDMQGWTRGERA